MQINMMLRDILVGALGLLCGIILDHTFSILLPIGPSKPTKPTQHKVNAVIVEVFEENSPMGCIGTNWNTVIRTDEGFPVKLCGKLGKVGDRIAGCMETSGNYPGFKLVCEE